VELARLFAPKPMFMGSATGDWTKNTPVEELPAVREVYRLLGAPAARVTHVHLNYVHNCNLDMREATYGWFNKVFFGAKSAEPVKEEKTPKPKLRERMLWWGRMAPKAIPFATFKTAWRKRIEEALEPCLKNAATARRTLGPLLPHTLSVTPGSVEEFKKRKPEGIRVKARGDALTITSSGRAKDFSNSIWYYTAYNRCIIGDRVHEILAAVERARGRVKLVGNGEAGTWCLLAAALSRKVKSVDADLRGFTPSSDISWTRHLDVPCIRQIGGLATIFALIGSRRMVLRGADAEVKKLAGQYAK
jgi:hypothetical protein